MGFFGNKNDDLKKKSQEEEEEEEEDEGVDTYTYNYSCDNCETDSDFEIPMGTRVIDYLEKNKDKCENCGCLIVDKEARGSESQEDEEEDD